jgi:hypothetical protein
VLRRCHPEVEQGARGHPEVEEGAWGHPEVEEGAWGHPEVEEGAWGHPEIEEGAWGHPEVEEGAWGHPEVEEGALAPVTRPEPQAEGVPVSRRLLRNLLDLRVAGSGSGQAMVMPPSTGSVWPVM